MHFGMRSWFGVGQSRKRRFEIDGGWRQGDIGLRLMVSTLGSVP